MHKLRFLLRCSLVLFFFVSVQSCANYKLNYTKEAAATWEQDLPPTNLHIKHSMYLVGDAGNAAMGETTKVLEYLKRDVANENENSSVVFLGDNIYPVGMPPKSDTGKRPLAEHRLKVQMDALKDFKGKIVFTPGNHDWATYGLKGIHRQEKFIEEYLNKTRNGVEDDDDKNWDEYYFPTNGCGDPTLIEVNDQLVIVAIDTNWWLRNWNKDQEINDGCEVKNRQMFQFMFEELLRKHRNKNIVISMHHPLYSNGPHGGYYTAKEHIFPLTQLYPNLYLPLPVLGSVAAFGRSTFGSRQDISHRLYQDLKTAVLAGAKKNGQFIFASGHEHSLQYFENENQKFIVSGSGSKESPTRVGNGGQFGYGKKGYARVDFYTDGSSWLEFIVPNEEGTDARVVFRKKLTEKLSVSKDNIPTSFPEFEKKETEISRRPINTPVKKVGLVHNLLLGKHYRDLYLKEYTFPVLDLSSFKGGMEIMKRGGGNQTNSLRMRDKDGHQYVMRALTKDASRFIPYPFNQISGTQSLVEDNFLSTHPFAPFAIADLADAANIYHTNPKLFYIPKQPTLSYHNDMFGGDVYLVEERAGGNWENSESLGESKKIISTVDVAAKITKNHKHKVDQQWAVRSRLFDLTIGDWDRHDDQWRWAIEEQEDGTKIYRPIPRDRDQPFSKYDGFVVGLARLALPFLRQLKTFNPDVKNMKWDTWSARYFDRTFLTELEWEDWQKEAAFIKANITDEIIDKALQNFPGESYDLTAAEISEILKSRRDNIEKFARQHYELVAKKVDVVGTEKRELFEVERLDNNRTKVTVWEISNKKRKKKNQVYQRVFEGADTDEIVLYGIGDDDEFKLTGQVKKGILVRIVGGLGKDYVLDESSVSGGSKKTKVYDSIDEENRLELGTEGKDLTSDKVEENTYDRRHAHYEYDFGIPFPILAYNQDDGLVIGLDYKSTKYKFKKTPYAEVHQFTGTFASAPRAFAVNYHCEFLQTFGEWGAVFNASYKGDRFSTNFFGIGNETLNPADDLSFNRVRRSSFYVDGGLRRPVLGGNGAFTISPTIERTQVDETPDRFISQDNLDLPDDIFEFKNYLGLRAKFDYENLDNHSDPHRGIRLHLAYARTANLTDFDRNFGNTKAELTLYQPLNKAETFVFATRVGVSANAGDYEFFQAPTLGGRENLRGFRAERFNAETVFFHNTDLRVKLFTSYNNIVPFSLGIHGGVDYGRAWQPGEESDKWHVGYGGGIWLAPVDFIILSLGYYVSDDDTRIQFTVGHQF